MKEKFNTAAELFLERRRVRLDERFNVLRAKCESPIEELMLFHFVIADMESGYWDNIQVVEDGDYVESLVRQGCVVVVPQRPAGRFRPDFTITGFGKHEEIRRVYVECDGHGFHEKSKEQAARDKSRDRELMSGGAQVIRFTGSEVWADAEACVWEALDVFWGVPR